MIYSHWHFCHDLKMMAQDSGEFLEIMFTLEDYNRSVTEKNKMLRKLELTGDLMLWSYALPVLVKGLWLERIRGQAEREDRERSFFYRKSEEMISATLERTKQFRQLDACLYRLQNPDEAELPKTINQLVELPCEKPDHEYSFSYLESEQCAGEIFQLSVMCAVAEYYPDIVSNAINERTSRLLDRAVNKEYGLLAWRLAMTTRSFCGLTFDVARKYFPEHWGGLPECMEIAARLIFQGQKSAADALIRESGSLIFFRKIRSEIPEEGFWIDEKTDKINRIKICAVLWQNILWNLAFESDALLCLKQIGHLWNTPLYQKKNNRKTGGSYEQRLLIPQGASVFDKEKCFPNYCCTPWQRREKDYADCEESDSPFREFPDMIHSYTVFRASAAAVLLRRLLGTADKPAVEYIRTLLNLGDAFQCKDTIRELYEEGKNWGNAICLLGRFAAKCVQMLGRGEVNSCIPEEAVTVICKGRQKGTRNEQLNYQYQFAGATVCVRWAIESMRAYTIQREAIENPWMAGEEKANMAQLLDCFFEDGIRTGKYQCRDAVLLFYQIFREEYEANVSCSDCGYWSAKYRETDENITFFDILFSKEPMTVEWADMGKLRRERFDRELWPSVLTLRLRTALESGEMDSWQDWYFEWRDEIATTVTEEDAYGLLFYQLTELFTVKIPEGKNSKFLPDIFQMIIETIYSFTTEETFFYRYRLSVNLISAWKKFDRKTGARAIVSNIAALYREREGKKQRDLLAYFLMQIVKEAPETVLSGIRKQLEDMWQEQSASEWHFSIQQIQGKEWSPLTDFCLQENRSQLSVVRSVQDNDHAFGNRKIRNLFRHPGEVTCREWYLGIVANKFQNNRGEIIYQINCGSSKIESCNSRANFEKGDVVGVNTGETGNLEKIGNVAWQNDVGSVRVGIREITAERIVIQLPNGEWSYATGNDRRGKVNFDRILSLWEPDVSVLLQKGKESSGNREELKAEAGFDRQLNYYVPVERDFQRFIVEQCMSKNFSDGIKLVFISKNEGEEEGVFLFSAGQGRNYRFDRQEWEMESLGILAERLKEPCQGLILTVRLKEEKGFPVLMLEEESSFEEKNCDWAKYFSDDKPFTIYRDGGEEKTDWYVTADVPGMPERITARLKGTGIRMPGRNQNVCNVRLSEEGWSINAQRRGEVYVEKLRTSSLRKEWSTPDKMDELLRIKAGDIIRLDKRVQRRRQSGYRIMEADSGLPVYCAVESLSLSQDEAPDGMICNRVCMVEGVEIRESQREASFEAKEIPELDDCPQVIKGIVAEFSEELNARSGSGEGLSLRVWLRLENKVEKLIVPVSAFEIRPRELGDMLEALRQDDGRWLFRAVTRRIQVRALWQLEDHKGERSDTVPGISLGRSLYIPGHEECFVTQAEEKPILYLWEENTRPKGKEDFACGVPLNKGEFSKSRIRYFDWKTFPSVKQKDFVCLTVDGKEFYGDSRKREFEETDKKAAWSVEARVYSIWNDNGIQYYDLRRIFHKKNRIPDFDRERKSREQDKLIDEEYKKWIEEAGYHGYNVTGAILDNALFQIEDLKVPQDTENYTIQDHWTDCVPRCDRADSWVAGPHYRKNHARAFLMEKGNKWVASCREARPFRVDQELDQEFANIGKAPIYFAGLDDEDRLRFEWGYGYTFVVKEEDILDIDGNRIGNNLFYGDKIEDFTLVKGEGEFGWRIYVEHKAIKRQIEGRIWDDCCCGEHEVVQLLEIRRDTARGTVRVDKVSKRLDDIRQGSEHIDGWEWSEVHYAQLEAESVQILLDEEEGGKDTRIIFAQLKREQEKKRTTCLTFTYIPLDGKMGNTSLLEGKVVCMIAGEITPTGRDREKGRTRGQDNNLANDYALSLYLPRELPEEMPTPHMKVSVLRREFSLDESKLRTLYPERKREYYKCNMVVFLSTFNREKDGVNEWRGSIVNTPRRRMENLKEWVSEQNTSCLVILGRRNGQILAEVAPGIISRIEENVVDGDFSTGTLAMLKMEEDRLRGKIVLPGDRRYLPQSGRPAELLIMDGSARNYAKLQKEVQRPGSLTREDCQETENELRKYHFTVAGLPQILLKDREALEKTISQPIPRLAYLTDSRKKEKGKGEEIEVKEGTSFWAARLRLDESGRPQLHYCYPEDETRKTEWGKISFMDATVSELTAFVKRGRWHYHDRKTAYYDTERHILEALPLPDGRNYTEIVLFPDHNGKLRYQESEFDKYGFPAREIIENGLPEQEGEYPVAGVTQGSIWLELFPGKIVEIPTDYLFVMNGKERLSNLWTGMLSPGDSIKLCQDRGFAGNQRKLIWMDITFGARSAFGESNNYFPIRKIVDGGLILGTDLWSVTLPVQKTEDWRDQKFVRISPFNDIHQLSQDCLFAHRDVLMVNCNARFLYVKDWGGLDIRLASPKNWENAAWLLEDLQSDEMKRWMQEWRLTLPVTVKNVRQTEGRMKVWVYYSQPDLNQIENGSIIRCNCIGIRRMEGSECEIVLRAGKTLFPVPFSHVLPGVPVEKAVAVVRMMRGRKISFWMHREEKGWFAGLRKVPEQEQVKLDMLFCVEDAGGILCQIADDLALGWISIENAARVGKMNTKVVWEALKGRRERSARRLEDGTLSLVDTWQSRQKYDVMKNDGTRYRVVPLVKAESSRAGENRFLAELYPFGDLISVDSETDYDCSRRDPIPVEIVEKQPGHVIAFPYKMRRTVMHLTPWVYRGLRKASRTDATGKFDGLSLYSFRRNIPECFEKYYKIYEEVGQNREKWELDYELLRDRERLSEQLVYLCSLTMEKRQGLNYRETYKFIRLTLNDWLKREGMFLATGFAPQHNGQEPGQIDVAPAIAAIRLLNNIKDVEEGDMLESTAKALSVHLTRMLGVTSGSTVHQELLLGLWLMQDEKRDGLWQRLNRLSLGGEDLQGNADQSFDGRLSPTQINSLRNVCHGILARKLEDLELVTTVESLLLSTGSLRECDSFFKRANIKDSITEKLSVMGRILTPSMPNRIAKSCLGKEELSELRTLFQKLMSRKSVPLSLVTDTCIPLSDSDREDYARLCGQYIALVNEKDRSRFHHERRQK